MHTEKMNLAIDDPGWEGGNALAVLVTLVGLRGVVSAGIDVAAERAYVEYDPTVVRLSDLEQAVEGLGFKVSEPACR